MAVAGAAEPHEITDVEVHADHLRVSAGERLADIPFDVAAITPPAGVFDLVLDHDRQTVFLWHGPGERDALPLDRLRAHYWLVGGAPEPGLNPLRLNTRRTRDLLRAVLDRPDLAVVHPRIRAALAAVDRARDTGVAEFLRALGQATLEWRRSGLDPGLLGALDELARSATRLRRGARPVLAIRRAPRLAVLRARDTDHPDALRDVLRRADLTRTHGVDPAAVDRLDLDGLRQLVADLRECEFAALFLLADAPPDEVTAPQDPREAGDLVRALSRPNAFLLSREQARRTGSPRRRPGGRFVGFFPGLGSRAFYQDLGRSPLDSGIPEVTAIYQEAAAALGFPGEPEKLLFTPANLPEGRLAQQGFIGAALLVHSLALAAQLRVTAARRGIPVTFLAYTGESFGIITSAVASGSLSVGDGVRIARAFTPLMLTAADGVTDEPVSRELARHLPESVRGPLVPEPHHVIGLRGDPDDLAEALADLDRTYPRSDVEVHKLYSWRQTNVYVRAGAKAGFDLVLRKFPGVVAEELKAATTFLAHSERMAAGRHALADFIDRHGIVFRAPHTPVVSNNDTGLLSTAAEIRQGVLAATDEVMASRATVDTLAGLRPDAVLELGLGDKSVRLLADNNLDAPATACTGDPEHTDLLLRAVQLAETTLSEMDKLRTSTEPLGERQHALLRAVFQLAAGSAFADRYLRHTVGRVVAAELPHPEPAGSPALREFLEIFQHTCGHRDGVDVAGGELVLRARLAKRITGQPQGQAWSELRVLTATGDVVHRSAPDTAQPEVVIFHFDRLADVGYPDLARRLRLLLDTQPLARQIYDRVLAGAAVEDDGFLTAGGAPTVDQLALSYLVYQYSLFQVLHLHRPAIFGHDHYLEGSDLMGWLVALAVSGAVPLPAAVRLYGAHLRGDPAPELERVLAALRQPDIPLISPAGIPVQSTKELEAATRAVFA